MKRAALANAPASWLALADGDFYMPGLATDGRTGRVPGAPDIHRRLFLERAAILEPELLASLRNVDSKDGHSLSAWARRWHLTAPWCLALARDTVRWHAAHPDAQGWEFQGKGIFVSNFPFPIAPLRVQEFYFDPTWRSRRTFEEYVLAHVARAVEDYCDRIEAGARAAGLKRVPRKRENEHLDWLARFQVKGESYASVARNASYKFMGGRQTVRKATST